MTDLNVGRQRKVRTEERKAHLAAMAFPERQARGRRSDADRQARRKRMCRRANGLQLPWQIARHFLQAERASLGFEAEMAQRHGVCEMPVEQVADIVGVSETTVRDARRKAVELGLLDVELRPCAGAKHLPNVVRLSRKSALGLRFIAWAGQLVRRKDWRPIGCKKSKSLNSFLSSKGRNPTHLKDGMAKPVDDWISKAAALSPDSPERAAAVLALRRQRVAAINAKSGW